MAFIFHLFNSQNVKIEAPNKVVYLVDIIVKKVGVAKNGVELCEEKLEQSAGFKNNDIKILKNYINSTCFVRKKF